MKQNILPGLLLIFLLSCCIACVGYLINAEIESRSERPAAEMTELNVYDVIPRDDEQRYEAYAQSKGYSEVSWEVEKSNFFQDTLFTATAYYHLGNDVFVGVSADGMQYEEVANRLMHTLDTLVIPSIHLAPSIHLPPNAPAE